MTAPNNLCSSIYANIASQWISEQRTNASLNIPQIVSLPSLGGLSSAVASITESQNVAKDSNNNSHVNAPDICTKSLLIPSSRLIEAVPAIVQSLETKTPTVYHVIIEPYHSQKDVVSPLSSGWDNLLSLSDTGAAILVSTNPQSAHDIALIAHAAALLSGSTVVHALDGNAGACSAISQVAIASLGKVQGIVNTAMKTGASTSFNFQSFPLQQAVSLAFELVNDALGADYAPFTYSGSSTAEKILFHVGALTQPLSASINMQQSSKTPIGAVTTHCIRPWLNESLLSSLPSSTKKLAVLSPRIGKTDADHVYDCRFFADAAAALQLGGVGNTITLKRISISLSRNHPVDMYSSLLGLACQVCYSIASTDSDIVRCNSHSAVNSCHAEKQTSTNLQRCNLNFSVAIWDVNLDSSLLVDRAGLLVNAAAKYFGRQATTAFVEVDFNSSPASSVTCTTLTAKLEETSTDSVDGMYDTIILGNTSLLFLSQYNLISQLKYGGKVVLISTWTEEELAFQLPESFFQELSRTGSTLHVIAPMHSVNDTEVEEVFGGANCLQAGYIALLTLPNSLSRDDLQHDFHSKIVGLSPHEEVQSTSSLVERWTYALKTRITLNRGDSYQTLLPPPIRAAQFVSLAIADSLVNEPGAESFEGQQGNRASRAYVELLNGLFGDRVVLADAVASKSLFFESYAPESDALTRVRSLFTDGTELCYGIYLARLHHRNQLLKMVQNMVKDKTCELSEPLRSTLTEWINHRDDSVVSKKLADSITKQLSELLLHTHDNKVDDLYQSREYFVKPSRWIIGGDAWARDIGFSGLHHIIASGEDVNVLVPETDIFSVPQPELRSKGQLKRDIALYAMNYGGVYVASISLYANTEHAIKALAEADAYPGPSIVVAYAPDVIQLQQISCQEHSDPIKVLTSVYQRQLQINESKAAVASGAWPLFRYNPKGKNLIAGAKQNYDRTCDDPMFSLDSSILRKDIEAFLSRQSQLSVLSGDTPAPHPEESRSVAARLVSLQEELHASSPGRIQRIDMKMLVLFGSDSGNGLSLAEKFSRKASMRGVSDVRCLEANSVTLDSLAEEDVIVFILSTAGQGEMCGNAINFWNNVRKAKSGSLKHLRYGIFGLGDSHYWGKGTEDSVKYFCKPARDMGDILKSHGATQLIEIGFGDDQHENGYMSTWMTWHEEIFNILGVTPTDDEEEITGKQLVDEDVKSTSQYLRGHITRSLQDKSTAAILPEDAKLTKFHGIYMQDDRDVRQSLEDAGKERAYSFMVRVGIPGGVCTPKQYLCMDKLADTHANGTLKLTTRQAYQLHGVLKWNLKDSIKGINKALMDTLAACGDVCRNVMANPNPYQSEVHAEVLDFARRLSAHLKPKTTAYHEIWLDKKMVAGDAHTDIEPLYGPTYLPRKFKVAIAVPPMNDVDVFAHCLGYIAIVENGKLVGWNVSVGGGMGMTHGNTRTYPRLADLLGFVTPEQAIEVGEKVMLVQRDYGDRVNRKHARLKYTVDDHGISWYREQVEAMVGYKLLPARPFTFESNSDRFGWTLGVDGKHHYGMFIENGRIRDTESFKLKTALRELAQMHKGDFRLTANQNLIVGSVAPADRPAIEALFSKYGIDNRYTGLRLNSIACVALPTCGLAMAESERYLPKLIDKIDAILERERLSSDAIVIRMSGCPNGCSRPYVAEIALVGKAPGTYNLYLGGGFSGNRLAKLYKESVGEEDILKELDFIISSYARDRLSNEHFGDFVIRKKIVAPTLAGCLFHETDLEANQIKTPSGTNQIYW